jgi:DNA-binding sugar fermentation-stimulating protein
MSKRIVPHGTKENIMEKQTFQEILDEVTQMIKYLKAKKDSEFYRLSLDIILDRLKYLEVKKEEMVSGTVATFWDKE